MVQWNALKLFKEKYSKGRRKQCIGDTGVAPEKFVSSLKKSGGAVSWSWFCEYCKMVFSAFQDRNYAEYDFHCNIAHGIELQIVSEKTDNTDVRGDEEINL